LKIYNDINALNHIKNPVLTTGTFDGVHIGHREIIRRIREIADKTGGETVLLTFEPHPRKVLFPNDENLRLLSTQQEKIALLEQAGLDHLIFYPFSLEFSRLSALEYVRNLLVNGIGVHTMVVGYDHHFGRNREGDFNQLLEFASTYGFDVIEIPAQEIDEVNVSSTKIRKALNEGDIQTANRYLGYAYSLTGTVSKGAGIGKTIGFPTANLETDMPEKLIPAQGVYAVKAHLNGKWHPAMLNIGTRPTVNSNGNTSIEAHIIGFNDEIYHQKLTLAFYAKIRNEHRFENLDELKAQLLLDEKRTLDLLKSL
jgi:riboflavin kinase/FMN adenylyltransferase